MATKHAVALRAFDHAGDSFAPGPAFPIDKGHLTDWSAVGLVREATAAEVAKLKGESAPASKPAPRRAKKKASTASAAAPIAPAEGSDVDPASDPAATAA